jgi:hypothetical protein
MQKAFFFTSRFFSRSIQSKLKTMTEFPSLIEEILTHPFIINFQVTKWSPEAR